MSNSKITKKMFTDRGWTEYQANKLVQIFKRHERERLNKPLFISWKKWSEITTAIYPTDYSDLATEIADANLYDHSYGN